MSEEEKLAILDKFVIAFTRDYDCTFNYDRPIAELTAAHAWHAPTVTASLVDKLLFIGLAYCEMIRADVMFQIGDGLSAHHRSRLLADELRLLKLQNLDWQRGKLIARQNIADIDFDFAQLFETFKSQCEKAASSQNMDKNDVDFLHWTLHFAERMAQSKQAENRDRLRLMRIGIIAMVSEVASVDAYRSVFEKYTLPRLRHVWGETMNTFLAKTKLEYEDVRQLELAIDGMDAHFGRNTVELLRNVARTVRDATLIESEIDEIFHSCDPTVPSGATGGLATCEVASLSGVTDAIQEKQLLAEKKSLARPLQFTNIPGSVSMMAREYAAMRSDNPCIIQYRKLIVENKDVLFAIVWFKDEVRQVLLPGALDLIQVARDESNVLKNASSTGDDQQIFQAKIPNREFCKRIWRTFLEPIRQAMNGVWKNIQRLVIIPESDCSLIPINLAWPDSAGDVENLSGEAPLAAQMPIAFSMSLTCFLGSKRSDRNDLKKLANDDVELLWNFPCTKQCEGKSQPCCPSKASTVALKENHPKVFSVANKTTLLAAARKQPELLFLGMHGSLLGPGIALQFADGYVTNFMLERSSFLSRTRLVLLGSCESLGADNWFSSMIGSFIAAGAGAVIGFPRRAYIKTISDLTLNILAHYNKSDVFTLDQQLTAFCKNACRCKSDDEKIMACLPQLWL